MKYLNMELQPAPPYLLDLNPAQHFKTDSN